MDLAKGASISVSLALKLMSGHARPSLKTIVAVEDWLRERVWSRSSTFKDRRREKKIETTVRLISETSGVREEEARAIAARRFPSIFSSSNNHPEKEKSHA